MKSLSADQVTGIEQFLDSQESGHPFQFPQWQGARSVAQILRIEGTIRWYGSFGVHFPLGRKVPWIRALVANRGPVCDDVELWNTAADELTEKMRRDRLAYLDVSPEWTIESQKEGSRLRNDSAWKCVGEPRVSLRLDLQKDDEEIFAGFRKNSRYEVRRAERAGTLVSPATNATEVEDFLRVYRSTAERKGFRADSSEEMRPILRWLTRDQSRGVVLVARLDGAVSGGVVIARAGRRCWYIWGASGKQPHATAGHILQWKALQWAKAHGCTQYDFGGYTPGATSGPAWFKEGFGGSIVHLTPVHRRVTEARRYQVLQLISRTKTSA